ncbi:MAG TPA: NHL repeat-containing protein [Candidatus Acidoferrum sp.]|nr:NHL repeat-containing protein [Candidatus Acidoferrum sp.]
MTLRARTILVVLLVATLVPLAADAWNRSPANTFASLPPGEQHPEGITADAAGNLYVTTFDVAHPGRLGQLFVFRPSGQLIRQVSVAGSSNLLLDLAFHPTTGALLVIDFGGHQVLNVNPVNGSSAVFATIPGGAAAGPNVLTFDSAGNVYISDSFQQTIWRTGPAGGAVAAWATSPLLGTTGVPPFGANGLAFNKAQTALFVANTGNDTIVKIPVTPGVGGPVAGTPAVFVNSINGPDGLIIDENDNLWVAANQADEIVVVDPSGRVIAKLGDFEGLAPNGAPRGLLFPASLVRVGNFIYVTNLASDLRIFGPANGTVDSQWASEVVVHTIARINAHLPPVQGLP